jgi:hypothetical protein
MPSSDVEDDAYLSVDDAPSSSLPARVEDHAAPLPKATGQAAADLPMQKAVDDADSSGFDEHYVPQTKPGEAKESKKAQKRPQPDGSAAEKKSKAKSRSQPSPKQPHLAAAASAASGPLNRFHPNP